MQADGSNRTSLVAAADLEGDFLLDAVWSPDGTKIAFVSASERTYRINMVDSDGSNLQRLTESGATDLEPVWSTDGSRIAFTRTTVISTADYTVNSDIYLLDADGSGIVQLTDDPSPDRWPVFMPKGTEIAFQSTRDGNDAIYVMNIDGSNLRLLTQVSLEPLPEDSFSLPTLQGRVAWSPDRTRIAVHTFDGKIVIMNSDGSNRTSLPYGTGFEYHWGAIPSWSPDGTKIAFMSGHDTIVADQGNYEIYVSDVDGSNLLRLTNSTSNDWFPTWSPVGTTVIYSAEGGGIDNEQGGIFVVELGPVTATDVAERPVELSPDVAMDKAALLALYAAADGPNWKYSTNWLSNRPLSDWYGVTTDSSGRVIKLELQSNQLDGQIPIELGNLSNLTKLNLSANDLSQEIPVELGNLANLTILNLSWNGLSGSIPIEMGNLVNLEKLELSYNGLTGTIPLSLTNLTNLTEMRLISNGLNGEIPSQLGNLSNLTVLILGGNSFSGEIPQSLGNLSNLRGLYVDNNELTGTIPAVLGNLTDLRTLWLQRNQLSGEIPAELGLLTEMTWLNLSQNQLSASVPTELGQLTGLDYLNISWNNLIGQLPRSFTNIKALMGFHFSANSGLCAPFDNEFQTWLRSTLEFSGDKCVT